MSLCEPKRTSRILSAGALIGLGLALGACGYKPMYGTQPDRASTMAYLRAVDIEHMANRTGQMMRTALKRRFHPTRSNVPYQYTLTVSLSESVSTLAVAKDATTTRANLQLHAEYTLVRNADHLKLHSGSVRSVSSYNLLTSNYATEAAQKDARERAVDTVADQLKTHISSYFNGPGRKQPALGQQLRVQ